MVWKVIHLVLIVQLVVECQTSEPSLKCYQIFAAASKSALLNSSCDSCFVGLPRVTFDNVDRAEF